MGYEDCRTVSLTRASQANTLFISDRDDFAVSLLESSVDLGVKGILTGLYFGRNFTRLSEFDFTERVITELKAKDSINGLTTLGKKLSGSADKKKKEKDIVEKTFSTGSSGLYTAKKALSYIGAGEAVMVPVDKMYRLSLIGVKEKKSINMASQINTSKCSSKKKEYLFVSIAKEFALIIGAVLSIFEFTLLLPIIALVTIIAKLWKKVAQNQMKLEENANRISPIQIKTRKAFIMKA